MGQFQCSKLTPKNLTHTLVLNATLEYERRGWAHSRGLQEFGKLIQC